MALIKCVECGKEISELADACPHCGNPINKKIQTIEGTSKQWKVIKLVSWILFLIGLWLALSGNAEGGFNNPKTGAGISLAFISFIGIMISKFGAWWSNK